jgi:hypothetical protein
MKAPQLAVHQGALPAGRVQFWSEGEWREAILMGVEIHGEPVRDRQRPPRVERLLRQGVEYLNAGEMALAEEIL